MRQEFTSTSTFSAELPYSNTFNTHCDICSHPISQKDINILQPCCCGPFHGYCITDLELQTRDSNPNNSNPQLTCPRCRQLVTAVKYNFIHDFPRASRPPFTTKFQPSPQIVLPVAINDTCPIPPNTSNNPKSSLYPKPSFSGLPQSWPSRAPTTLSPFSKPIPPPPIRQPSPYHTPQNHPTPTAPPASHDDIPLPFDVDDSFPPPSHHFQPYSSHTDRPPRQPSPSFQRRHFSNFAAESSTSRFRNNNDHIDLPSPHDGIPSSPPHHKNQRRNRARHHENHSRRDSPKTVVICRHVSEEDVRNGLYGDDVYKAYVKGKTTVLGTTDESNTRTSKGKAVNVKIEMDLHVYHHHKPLNKSTDQSQDRKTTKAKDRRKIKSGERTWWKSPRCGSRLDSREEDYSAEHYRVRGSSRRS